MIDPRGSHITRRRVEEDINVRILHPRDLLSLENLVRHSRVEGGAQLEKMLPSR